MTKGWIGAVVSTGAVLIMTASCSKPGGPTSPTSVASGSGVASITTDDGTHMHTASAEGKPEDKGYIDGWFEGSTVQLYYTKSYFCAELPSSTGAPCEIGAPPQESPRPGPIPTIYAIAAAGFTPPAGTAACLLGTPCLNHPLMIDLSRIGGRGSATPVSHSHVLGAHGGGWFNTVNIRVFSLAAWNEIASAKSLAKVRELQGNNPQLGTPGVISADTPTNIYFFIASWRPN
jgi:hypothetical protein